MRISTTALATPCAKKDAEGAIKHLLKALAIDPKYAMARNNLVLVHLDLGNALLAKKDTAGAIQQYRMALDVNPASANAHLALGNVLRDTQDAAGAIEHYRKAIDLNPNWAEAHVNLGRVFYDKKDLATAVQHFQKAIDINPSHAVAHSNLGNCLRDKKDGAGALKHCLKAVELDPDHADAHNNLGNVLFDKKDVDGAIKHYRKALEINPKLVLAHNNLGAALGQYKKDLEGAIQHIRKAIDLEPNNATTHHNLPRALLMNGQFAEARTATLAGLKLLAADDPQRKTAQERLQKCDQLQARDQQLSAILRGDDPPNNAAELLALADLCVQYKSFYAAAAHFHAAALAKDPKLADDLPKHVRHDAACTAALAGTGKGKDAGKLADQERSSLRRQALDWLRADLALLRKRGQGDKVEEVVVLIETLPQRQSDPALSGVRDAKNLASLPKEEQQSWQQLWADAAQLLKETKARFSATQHQGALNAKQIEKVHEVKMLVGKTYVLDLESTQFDAYLRLEDAKGNILAENDDIGPDNQNARLDIRSQAGRRLPRYHDFIRAEGGRRLHAHNPRIYRPARNEGRSTEESRIRAGQMMLSQVSDTREKSSRKGAKAQRIGNRPFNCLA